MARASAVSLVPVGVAGEIVSGDDLVAKLALALRHQKESLRSGDILVIKHKIVSKAEGRFVELAQVKPSIAATRWARSCNADARLVQLAFDESCRIVRKKMVKTRSGRHGVLITETRHGFVCANSGIDLSNVDGGKRALLLPKHPDRSAARLRSAIQKIFGVRVAVIISDSFGRPWREGLTEVALGVAGMKPIVDYRGKRDAQGYVLHASAEAVADELACAAGLVCGKLNQTPFCIIRGFRYETGRGSARDLIRGREHDLFR